MAKTEPNGKVYLCKNVPLTSTYQHTIYFSSLSEQLKYFTGANDGELTSNDGFVVKVLTEQNYIKKDSGKIRLQAQEEEQNDVNYMIWKTPVIGNKPSANYVWFFAFITDITYISNAVIELTYELDVLQTYAVQSAWNGAVSFKQCMVERLTPTHDNVGQHIEAEPVSFTNYVNQNAESIQDESGRALWEDDYDNFVPIVFSTYNLRSIIATQNLPPQTPIWGKHAGLLQGAIVNVFRDMNSFIDFFGLQTVQNNYNAIMESIISVIAVPRKFAQPATGYDGGYYVDVISDNIDIGGDTSDTKHMIFTRHISGALGENVRLSGNSGGYTPIYKKLYTYPFNYLYLTNNNGDSLELRYEYFNTDTTSPDKLHLRWRVAVQPDFEIFCYPINYAGKANDYDNSISLMQVPIIPFITDSYSEWLGTSKTGSILSSLASGVGFVAGSVANPSNIGLSILGGFGALSGSGSLYDAGANAKWAKDKMHTGGTSAKILANGYKITGYQRCVNEIDAQMIDAFFDRYGYAVRKIMTPPIDIPNVTYGKKTQTHRYIKTNGCLCVGGCNAKYLRQIEKIFDSGITWWDKDHVGEYLT